MNLHTPIITGADAEVPVKCFKSVVWIGIICPKDDKGNVDESQDFFVKKLTLPYRDN